MITRNQAQRLNPIQSRLYLQHGLISPSRFVRSQHVTTDFIRRLGLEKELDGHTGCVNCIEWNERGTRLASGSDDCSLIIWDPFQHKKLFSMPTQHNGNIFSVKFLPNMNDSLVVTGAADFRIRVHDVDRAETRHVFACHTGRVKRLATAPTQAYLFWSAAEDGTVRQFDLRDPDLSNIIINLNTHDGAHAEAKCIQVNPLRPELLAVGGNDPYVRIFDRRFLSPQASQPVTKSADLSAPRVSGDTSESLPTNGLNSSTDAAQYYIPGHFQLPRRRTRNINITYLAFSSNGDELVANMGGEHIYLFSLHNPRPTFRFVMPTPAQTSPISAEMTRALTNGRNGHTQTASPSSSSNSSPNSQDTPSPRSSKRLKRTRNEARPLPLSIENIKKAANAEFEAQHYAAAVNLYNEAIRRSSDFPVLYCNRAAAYLKRQWDGDIYAALLDCYTALSLDSNHVKAHFRLVRCLRDLNWVQEASQCLEQFKLSFPEQATALYVTELETTLGERLKQGQRASSGIRVNGQATEHRETISDGNTSSSSSASGESVSNAGGGETGATTVEGSSETGFEVIRRDAAYDYTQRYVGHCNTTTDIKEANFFGSDGQFIMAGSDDGSIFFWDRYTANIVRVLRGDDSIVNCLQPHPSVCLLASSGIDHVVRLWSPRPEQDYEEEREIKNFEEAAINNQKRMNADPLEVMLINMGYTLAPRDSQGRADNRNIYRIDSGSEEDTEEAMPCRTS